jgi:hypothetical protein
MKTSKIIFFSLIGAITLGILLVFVNITIKAHSHPVIAVNKQTLPAFKVMYINDCRFNLEQSDSSFMEIKFLKNTAAPSPDYKIKGDTLVISGFYQTQGRESYPSIKIFSTDSLYSIILKNSDITIKKILSAKLNLDMDNSAIWFNQDSVKRSSFNDLEVLAKNHSVIDATSFKIENLSINLQKSHADLAILAGKINGTASDSSIVSVHVSGEISLKADRSSTLRINE